MIRSYKVKIDISCEILLNDTLSTQIGSFKPVTFSWMIRYGAKFRVLSSLRSVVVQNIILNDSDLWSQDRHFMWDFAQGHVLEPHRVFPTRYILWKANRFMNSLHSVEAEHMILKLILSYAVKIEISFEILVYDTISSQIVFWTRYIL